MRIGQRYLMLPNNMNMQRYPKDLGIREKNGCYILFGVEEKREWKVNP